MGTFRGLGAEGVPVREYNASFQTASITTKILATIVLPASDQVVLVDAKVYGVRRLDGFMTMAHVVSALVSYANPVSAYVDSKDTFTQDTAVGDVAVTQLGNTFTVKVQNIPNSANPVDWTVSIKIVGTVLAGTNSPVV